MRRFLAPFFLITLLTPAVYARRGETVHFASTPGEGEGYLALPEVFADDAGRDEHGEFDPDDDPLLDKAIEIVVQTQTASVSLLQRRLRVGYTRAGRLVDMLERRGIISGYEGSKPRRVLVDEAALTQR